MSEPAGPASELPAERTTGIGELEVLLTGFARLEGIADPVRRHFEVLREAERSGFAYEAYSTLFSSYLASRRSPRRSLDLYISRLVAWFEGLSLFSLLGHIGRLGLLFAVISFIVEYPKRQNEWRAQTWQVVESASGKVYSSARVKALEQLNGACVDLEGAHARGAMMPGLALDRCYAIPGGGLLKTS